MGVRVSLFSCFTVLVFLLFSFSVNASRLIYGNETDRVALLEFKSKISLDPLGVLGSWNQSIHFCKWHGVTCSHTHKQRVTALDLTSLELAGSISPHIGNLSFLKQLILQNNSLTGQIPSEIGGLRRLQYLALSNTSIGGEISASISNCSNLFHVRLSGNQLVGQVPSELGSLSKIEYLSLQRNHLTGSIPSSLGNLSFLQSLLLGENKLDGKIPFSFGGLKNLKKLGLYENMLSGTMPSEIFNISSLEAIDGGNNQFQGDIPLTIGFTLPNLKFFSISSNQITGTIPSSISNASKLELLQLQRNKLTGEVPSLENLRSLRFFSVVKNSLGSGGHHHDLNFLCSLTDATILTRLSIDDNNFGGVLPGCITNFSKTLTVLSLGSNKIFGSIPAGIGKLVNLQALEMSNNRLSGTIPSAIADLQELRILSLYENRFSGNIPHSIGNLKKLILLILGNNFLEGDIPSSLGQCKSLIGVDLSYNNVSGAIAPELFIALSSLSVVLDLSNNQLNGSLPIEVGNLKNLEELHVDGNNLEGDIPSTLGSCIKLEQLLLQDNLFQGSIPSSLSFLRGLTILDLSQNNLSGEIPLFLLGFQLLKYLNLSYNDLEGVVPTEGIFKNASEAFVFGNSKLCGGTSDFKLPTCAPNKSKERRLTLALKLVIAIVSGLAGIALALSASFLWWVRKRTEKSSDPSNSINSLPSLSYQNLYIATDGFSSARLIGAGSFGSVYKGILDEGRTIVAVKVFNLQQHGASRSFVAECSSLRNIRHRNLVKVLTACSGVDYQGSDFKALVYEFMNNGSLEEWLHPVVTGEGESGKTPKCLNLFQRLNLAIDVACALNYLHHDCEPPTAHCDLKPSNILLDDNMTARLGDFGLARLLPPTHTQTSSIGIKGSIGYIAPEYGLGSEVSRNGDVYSYGILLLELVTRKRPSDIMFEGDMNLHNFARMALPDHVNDIVDSTLLLVDDDDKDEDLGVSSNERQRQRQRQTKENKITECLISMVRIGVACSMETPQDRMNITNAVYELQSIKKVFLGT